jgi:hypothetical protein
MLRLHRSTNHRSIQPRDTNHRATNHLWELGRLRRGGDGDSYWQRRHNLVSHRRALRPITAATATATATATAAAAAAAAATAAAAAAAATATGPGDSSFLRAHRWGRHHRAPRVVGTATKAAHEDESKCENDGEGDGDGDYKARGSARLDRRCICPR